MKKESSPTCINKQSSRQSIDELTSEAIAFQTTQSVDEWVSTTNNKKNKKKSARNNPKSVHE